MDSHLKLKLDSGDALPHPVEYQALASKLIYLTLTRPDVAFTVHQIKGSCLAICAQLQAFCDSDWAGCASTRSSTSAFYIMLGKSPVSWKSKRQSIVSRSSVEDEYRSIALAICEVMWLKYLLKDLGIKHTGSTPIFCDNKAALQLLPT
ncbi:uncharacterized mitochondrial protein AtMg00810-like [Beta vulgaris subsp. vulgaris]|uniref:uncharacterized mitochondrial protein AtMg00810-like n=1 Tax=Beta vulgaris subsp. vulgaris TaxID=3555 RepID=UPI00090170BE|nr:uncharacterized mitochondrial protein AtMg00810-like [Beta vulgaris subsp. vulgaris]